MIPVIMSGGSGTRLWPVSRFKDPKQFCEFFEDSLISETIQRFKEYSPAYLLTIKEFEIASTQVLERNRVSKENLILEPFGRNTAPAIALLCHIFKMRGLEDEIVGVFPADHMISMKTEFLSTLNFAIECAEKNEIVTLGIKPTHPATGYGYIEITNNQFLSRENGVGVHNAHFVKAFREKPTLDKAKEFVTAGNYYWNAGMFLFRISTMIDQISQHLPEIWNSIERVSPDLSNLNEIYENLESISIDYGVMEKLESQVCVPCDIGWSDVGTWEELARIDSEKQDLGLKRETYVFNKDAKNNYAFSKERKVVGFIGVEDLIVADTHDGLLVMKKGSGEKVKHIVDQIKNEGLQEATEHNFERRPWGKYEILKDDLDFKLKKITVSPGQRLSYQSHKRRSEHWVVVQGEGVVVLNDDEIIVKRGQHIYIPKDAKHRICNNQSERLVFVEVQVGDYFGEDDIIRYSDDYFRV